LWVTSAIETILTLGIFWASIADATLHKRHFIRFGLSENRSQAQPARMVSLAKLTLQKATQFRRKRSPSAA
jgi:hypothetical protein